MRVRVLDFCLIENWFDAVRAPQIRHRGQFRSAVPKEVRLIWFLYRSESIRDHRRQENLYRRASLLSTQNQVIALKAVRSQHADI
jgi:hypothetical protein